MAGEHGTGTHRQCDGMGTQRQGEQMDAVYVDCGDERRLLQRAQEDPAAFDTLYRTYAPPVYRYLRSRVTTDEDAADLTQQVFMQALQALPNYQYRNVPFTAWLIRIARNSVIDAHRRHRPTVPWETLPESAHPTLSHTHSSQHEALVEFEALIAPLTDSEQELLILRFVVGLPTKDIAAIVGKRDGAIRMQLTRSLRALKESIHDA